jgi:acetoin utilization deacetylase AcuC-like enzyme
MSLWIRYGSDDHTNVLFASVHGYGESDGHKFYPSSGRDCVDALQEEIRQTNQGPHRVHSTPSATRLDTKKADGVMQESVVLNYGMPHMDDREEARKEWRRVWAENILPRLAAFKPEVLFICAGFDAHKKDVYNLGFIQVDEADYEWLTYELVKIANLTCEGRIVSVLEGGYRVQGQCVSAFGRSVACHVRELLRANNEKWAPASEGRIF